MPYKDKSMNSFVAMQSIQRLYYPYISVRFKRSESYYDALLQAVEDLNITKTEYCYNAILNQLRKDGYIK